MQVGEYGLDYLRVTVHASKRECISMYERYFQKRLSLLVSAGHGSLGFKEVLQGLEGFRLLVDPSGAKEEYCSYEFSGRACACVHTDDFKQFFWMLEGRGIRYSVTRLDVAIDNVGFTPADFKNAVLSDRVRTDAKRHTLRWVESPLQEREDGSGLGADTCYLGSRQSERFLRVYNKRGPVRIELEFKGGRAQVVARDLFLTAHNWYKLIVSHIRDYVEVEAEWWKDFVGSIARAGKKLVKAGEKTLEKKVLWLEKQVAKTFVEVMQITSGKIFDSMFSQGMQKMRNDQRLLSIYGIELP